MAPSNSSFVRVEAIEERTWKPVRLLIALLLHLPRLRPLLEKFVVGRLRRRLTSLGLLEGYRDFKRLGTIPRANFIDEFTLYQAAELIGTVGTFHGPGALDQVIAELRETFDEVDFSPESMYHLDDERMILTVRFSATGGASGIAVSRPIAHLWTMRGLRASRLEVYWEIQEALVAAGAHHERVGDAPRSASAL